MAKRLVDFFGCGFAAQAVLFPQITDGGGVLDEFIRPPDANDWGLDLLVSQMIANDAAVAALQYMILDGHDDVCGTGKKLGGSGVDWLGVSRVDDGGIDVLRACLLYTSPSPRDA